jgi:multiple sugar transport system permease protein
MQLSLGSSGTRKRRLPRGFAIPPRTQQRLLPYVFLLPAVIALLTFSVYPFVSGVWYSFTSIRWVTDQAHFVGLDNYQTILTATVGSTALFKEAFVRTIYWTLAVVAGQFILGLAVALVLNEVFPGRGVFRSLILAPIALPTVILGLTWQWMYDPNYGLINHYLQMFGLIDGPKVWVGQSDLPMYPIVIVAIWRGFPLMALMLLSGLQGISSELYEVAKVDGANVLDRFVHVTLPQLRTIIVISLMLHLIWWWNHFDLIKIIGTHGADFPYGSATLSLLAWFESFRWDHLAYGAAISVMAMIIVAGLMIWNARREMRAATE